jgi:thioredoxin 1
MLIYKNILLSKIFTTMVISTLDKGNFNQKVISNSKPVLVLFAADWCSPCRVLRPILEEYADENNSEVDIFTVDVTKYDSLAARYTVKALPTVILFRDGEEVDRFWGVKTKDALDEMLAD